MGPVSRSETVRTGRNSENNGNNGDKPLITVLPQGLYPRVLPPPAIPDIYGINVVIPARKP